MIPVPYHWGAARFGKHDGFELTEQLGALAAFDRADARSLLSHALQLRQEEIRPFEGAEILGMTTLSYQRDTYRLLTLYRYGLDRYKRDGYLALTLALKNCRGDSRGWLRALRMLAAPGSTPGQCGFDATGHPPFACQPERSQGRATSTTPIFIPLNEGSFEEEVALLDAWQQQLEAEYQSIYASASAAVSASIDRRRIDVWASNPFGRRAIMPEPRRMAAVAANQSDHAYTPPPQSLIYAHEETTEHAWTKTVSPTVKPAPMRRSAPWKRLWPWLAAGVAVTVALGWILGS
jgi:hypothetical protein